MISKKEFEQMNEFQSKIFTITQKSDKVLTTDYRVLIVKTDIYAVGITRKTYDDKDYEFIRDAVDRLVIDTYEELEWLIKATIKYDNERTV